MPKVIQYLCDNCGKVVGGMSGTAKVKETYFQIRGQVIEEFWSEKHDRRCFFYVTDGPTHEITFCSIECFGDYIAMKREQFKKMAEERLDRNMKTAGYDSFPDPGWSK